MKYAGVNNEIFIRLGDGEEIRDSISKALSDLGVTSAVILGGIGMLKEVTFGWFTGQKYITETKEEEFELLNLSGNVCIKEGQYYVHTHVTLGHKDHSIIGGHALELRVYQNAEIAILPLRSIELAREYDGNFLAIAPRPKV